MPKLSYEIDWESLDEQLDSTPQNEDRQGWALEVSWDAMRGEDFRVESPSNNYRV